MSKVKNTKFSIKKIKKEYILVLILCVVGAYLVFSSFTSNKTTNKNKAQATYANQLESDLKNILSKVKGVGTFNIKISVDGKYNNLIAQETITTQDKNGTITTTKPIYVNGKPVYLKEGYPNVVGVIVVTSSADNLSVREGIISAITTYLDCSSSIIIILKGK